MAIEPTDISDLASAHKAWDDNWTDADVRADWLTAAPEVVGVLPKLRKRGVEDVLDLGCGVGRHAQCLAREGFQVTAMDASESGLAFARKQAEAAGLAIDYRTGQMTELPFPDRSFDYVLSWNVIYHGDGEVVGKVLAEVARVLRDGGLFQATMLSTRHALHGRGRQIAPNTFVIDDIDDLEKRHPHFYCDAHGLIGLFNDYLEVIEITQINPDENPDAYHWQVQAERRAGT